MVFIVSKILHRGCGYGSLMEPDIERLLITDMSVDHNTEREYTSTHYQRSYRLVMRGNNSITSSLDAGTI